MFLLALHVFYFHCCLPKEKIGRNGSAQDGNKNADKVFVELYCRDKSGLQHGYPILLAQIFRYGK